VASHAINPAVYGEKMPFDPEKDFAPLTMLAITPNVLVVNAERIKAANVPELIALLKENPGKFNYGSSGVGTTLHVGMELFAQMTGTQITHVPYRGSGPMLQDLISGQLDLALDGALTSWPHVQSGKLRALAVSTPKRAFFAPDLPTLSEFTPGLEVIAWHGFFAPAKTPADRVQKIASELQRILSSPEVADRILAQTAIPTPMSPTNSPTLLRRTARAGTSSSRPPTSRSSNRASMRIRSVRHWLIRLPFKEDILWGSGRRSGATRLIVRIGTDDGVVGWGETISLIDAVPAVLEKIVAPLAIGYEVADAERFHRHVLGAGYYHHKRAVVMAAAAMEMAMWDALGKRAGLPLFALWGGRWRKQVEASAYIFVNDPAKVKDTAKRFLDDGFKTFKIKIGVSMESDLPLVEAVKSVAGQYDVRADVNGAWTPGSARRQLAKLAPFDLAYVEQPLELDDLAGHVELRAAQTVPIALDESAYTLADVGNIIRMGAADVVLLDPHEAGGLWQVIKQAAICESVGIPVTLHSGGEGALSQSAYVHLAASIANMSLAIDTERTYLGGDIAREPVFLKDGAFTPSDRPGLGVDPDEDLITRFAVDRIEGAYLDPQRPDWFPVKPAY
ncbi:MAG: tripartite tricarboxylate transporter substrate-binding protein, partial [Beijerinckiaceae bacterium]